ncbi:helix-turn-helix domain-containing protein [Actinomadura bangladeshensis]|uniref:Helix-turn-helix domain-containing protein n=1 Tax=Actinomadura bangladeshensis TaxID=453573 RepID=A0A6L9QU53_9ACTN|nr:helix-turn-helix transcriptional regulator [Actinomadura bangladeshensis]NEA28676.1 helix-turn-helix domain-containing protein [Actinomadura bangladeshensis]
MSTSRGPSVRQRRLAAELRRLRERRGLTGDEVADRLSWSTAKVSRIENARTGAKIDDVGRLLELYEIDGPRHADLISLARDAAQRGWWEEYRDLPSPLADFIALESEATAAREWGSTVFPGLLQTENYARHVIGGWSDLATLPPQELERRLDVRMRRRELLDGPRPLELSAVLDEAVLQRLIGDQKVMREQLEHLYRMTGLPNVTVQILPLGIAHSVLAESFILLEFSPVHDILFPDIVHVESLTISHFADEAVTYMYRLAYSSLAGQALDADESRRRIAAAKDAW